MRRKWNIGLGFMLLALCVPVLALGAPTKAELKAGNQAKVTQKQAAMESRKSMKKQQKTLFEERRALRKEMNKSKSPETRAAFFAKRQQMVAQSKATSKARKGGSQL